jgi:hypothetical protein
LPLVKSYWLHGHYVHAAANAAVIGLALLAAMSPLGFAAIGEEHLAAKQLHAREQKYQECCDPKDGPTLRHCSLLRMP